jgi:hypothetical protein
MIRLPAERATRPAFWLYAATIFALTHWPRLALPETGLQRPDLYVHASVFALWTTLFNLTGYLGPVRSPRAIGKRAAAAALYACLDEGTQAIPFVHRDAEWDDLSANLTGIALATVAMLLLARRPAPRS